MNVYNFFSNHSSNFYHTQIGFFKRKRPGKAPGDAEDDAEGQGEGGGEAAPLQGEGNHAAAMETTGMTIAEVDAEEDAD